MMEKKEPPLLPEGLARDLFLLSLFCYGVLGLSNFMGWL